MEQWELIEQNPWWENPEKINEDSKIKEFSHSRLQWFPRIFNEFDFSFILIFVSKHLSTFLVNRIVLTNIFLMRLLSISPNKFEYNQNIESFISSLFILSIIFNIWSRTSCLKNKRTKSFGGFSMAVKLIKIQIDSY